MKLFSTLLILVHLLWRRKSHSHDIRSRICSRGLLHHHLLPVVPCGPTYRNGAAFPCPEPPWFLCTLPRTSWPLSILSSLFANYKSSFVCLRALPCTPCTGGSSHLSGMTGSETLKAWSLVLPMLLRHYSSLHRPGAVCRMVTVMSTSDSRHPVVKYLAMLLMLDAYLSLRCLVLHFASSQAAGGHIWRKSLKKSLLSFSFLFLLIWSVASGWLCPPFCHRAVACLCVILPNFALHTLDCLPCLTFLRCLVQSALGLQSGGDQIHATLDSCLTWVTWFCCASLAVLGDMQVVHLQEWWCHHRSGESHHHLLLRLLALTYQWCGVQLCCGSLSDFWSISSDLLEQFECAGQSSFHTSSFPNGYANLQTVSLIATHTHMCISRKISFYRCLFQSLLFSMSW